MALIEGEIAGPRTCLEVIFAYKLEYYVDFGDT
jgi:hypothetical protein